MTDAEHEEQQTKSMRKTPVLEEGSGANRDRPSKPAREQEHSPMLSQLQAGAAQPGAPTRWSLVKRARSADPDTARNALQELIKLYAYTAFLAARSCSACRAVAAKTNRPESEVAADAVQRLFLSVIARNSLKTLREEGGHFRAWLCVSAVNEVRQELRKENRGINKVTSAVPWLDEVAAELRYVGDEAMGLSLEEVSIRAFAQDTIAAARKKLAEQQTNPERFAIIEKYLLMPIPRGIDAYAGAASQAKVSVKTIASGVSDMRAQFRRILSALVRESLDEDDPDFEELFERQRREVMHYLVTEELDDPPSQ